MGTPIASRRRARCCYCCCCFCCPYEATSASDARCDVQRHPQLLPPSPPPLPSLSPRRPQQPGTPAPLPPRRSLGARARASPSPRLHRLHLHHKHHLQHTVPWVLCELHTLSTLPPPTAWTFQTDGRASPPPPTSQASDARPPTAARGDRPLLWLVCTAAMGRPRYVGPCCTTPSHCHESSSVNPQAPQWHGRRGSTLALLVVHAPAIPPPPPPSPPPPTVLSSMCHCNPPLLFYG